MTNEQLQQAAQFLWPEACFGEVSFMFRCGKGYEAYYSLLSPDGRDLIEKRLVEMGYTFSETAYEDEWGINLRGARKGIREQMSLSLASTPAEALILAVLELAKGAGK